VGLASELKEELDTPSQALPYDVETFVLLRVPTSAPAGCSPRAFGEVDYFAKDFSMWGVPRVLAWLGGRGWLVICDRALGLFCESESPSPTRSKGLAEGLAHLSFVSPHTFFLIKRRA
jgi:hypothetical protein